MPYYFVLLYLVISYDHFKTDMVFDLPQSRMFLPRLDLGLSFLP